MAGPFKMKSGNSPLFKQMGSSPVRQTKVNPTTGKVEIDLTTKPAGTGTVLKPKKENKKSNDPYAKAKKKDPNLNKYITERKKHKPGSDAYEAAQAKINAAYGKTRSSKVKASQIKTEAKETFTPGGEGDVLTKNIKDTSQKGDEAVRPKQQGPKENPQGTRAKRIASGKKLKSEQKVAKIAATAKVKTARAKSGRGSAEVKAAKQERKATKRAQKTARLERKRDVTLGVGGTGASQRAARIQKRIERRKAKAAKA